jgi:hypothetical protein
MTEQHSQVEVPKFGGLDNKELLMVFYKMKDVVKNLDENLDKRKIQKVVDTPMGRGVAYIDISQEKVDKFKSSDYYKILHNLVNKLQPIVEVIEDCDASCKSFADELR